MAVIFQSEKLEVDLLEKLNQYKVSMPPASFLSSFHLLNSLLGTLLLESSLVHQGRVRFQYWNIKCRFVKQ